MIIKTAEFPQCIETIISGKRENDAENRSQKRMVK